MSLNSVHVGSGLALARLPCSHVHGAEALLQLTRGMCITLQLSDQRGGLGASVAGMAAGSEAAQAAGIDLVSSSGGSSAGGGANASGQAGASGGGGSGDKQAADAEVGQVCHDSLPSLSDGRGTNGP
jgi:hypothetical protein